LPASSKVIIDTNVFIDLIEKKLEQQSAVKNQNLCYHALKTLNGILHKLYEDLSKTRRGQYVHFVPNQVEELKKWLNTRICRSTRSVDKEVDKIIADWRRISASSATGFRVLKASEINTRAEWLKRVAEKRVGLNRLEEQISSIGRKSRVDELIAYFALGSGVQKEKVKVITTDDRLYYVLSEKAVILGLQNYVKAVYVPRGGAELSTVTSAVSDP